MGSKDVNPNNNRSKNVKKNIIYSFGLKSVGILLSFLLLPLTVNYLSEIEYGVWVTLFSVMNWVNFLDMGIGLGLRNKLAEAVSRDNLKDIQTYMSTGIAAMIGMGILLLILFLIGVQFIDMQVVFNTKEISEADLYKSVLWTAIFVILTFVLSVINQIYYAYQKAAVTGAIQIMHNLIMLIIVYYLTLQVRHNMFYFVLSFGIASLSSKVFFIIYFFYKNRRLYPKLIYVEWAKIKGISTVGIKFFIIQLTCIVTFSSSNILITQCLGPEYVRAYDVVFKIFSIITMGHGLICSPLWNAYTDAYVRKDFQWIEKSLKKMQQLMFVIILLTLLIVWKINWIISLWISTPIDLPIYLSASMGLFVIITCWTNIWAIFLNGIGKIELQMYSTVVSATFIIASSSFFMKYLSSAGMILSMDIGWLFSGLVLFFQVKNITKKLEQRL